MFWHLEHINIVVKSPDAWNEIQESVNQRIFDWMIFLAILTDTLYIIVKAMKIHLIRFICIPTVNSVK